MSKKCINCGYVLDDSVKFCSQCGSSEFENCSQYPLPVKKKGLKKWKIFLIVFGVLLFMGGVIGAVLKLSDSSTTISESEIVGTWKASVSVCSIGDVAINSLSEKEFKEIGLSKEIMLEVLDLLKDVNIDLYYVFEEDGSFIVLLNKENYAEVLKTATDHMFTYMENGGIYKMAEAAGKTRKEVDQQLEEMGWTVEEYIEIVKSFYGGISDANLLTEMENGFDDYENKEYFVVARETYSLSEDTIVCVSETDKKHYERYKYIDGKLILYSKAFLDSDDEFIMTFSKISELD